MRHIVFAAMLGVLVWLPGMPSVDAAESSRDSGRREIVHAQAEETLEGGVEVLIEDSDRGSRTLYFLISEDCRIALRFTVKPGNLTTGARIRVGGRYDPDGTFVVSKFERLSDR